MRLLADEGFRASIVAGLLQRDPTLDIVTVQSIGLAGAQDEEILDWAGTNGRVLLSHDVTTVPTFAYERTMNGKPMPGVILVPWLSGIGDAIEAVYTVVQTSLSPDEYADQVIYAPV